LLCRGRIFGGFSLIVVWQGVSRLVEFWGKCAYLNFPEEWTLGPDGVLHPADDE
jgi:hypothetical protein